MDLITSEIIRNSLFSIAREMKVAVMRTAASPIIHSGGDVSAAVFDSEMRMVAQGNDVPTMLGSAVFSTRESVNAIGVENLRPGDVIASNDVYLGGGNHLPDVQFTRPIFADGKIVAYVMTRGHWADIGGQTPGSWNPAAWDVFGEGIRIPPLLLYRDDKPVRDIMNLIMNNTRDPDNRHLDIQAQYAGVFVGEQRVLALAARYGSDAMQRAMAASLDHSERMIRARIAAVPDGVYEAEDFIEPVEIEGWSRDLIPIRVRIAIRGDTIDFDYTGTGAQARGGINCPYAVTCNSTWFAVKAILGAGVPINEGCYRPITITAPKGTIVNCVPPAAVVSGSTETSPRVIDLLLTALAPAVPDKVIAQSHSSGCAGTFAGNDPDEMRCRLLGRSYVSLIDVHPGGLGGRPDKDGVSAVRVHVGNAGSQSVEFLESMYPLRVDEWALIPDSGGAGRWRGGCGSRRVYSVEFDEATFSIIAERGRIPPRGMFGGLDGSCFRAAVVRADGREERIAPKGRAVLVFRGDQVVIEAAGSGGYGPPRQRPLDLVLRDVADGYVTPESLRRDYGRSIPEPVQQAGGPARIGRAQVART